MSELVGELLLRLAKVGIATLLGVIVYLVEVVLLGVTGSPQVAVEAWIVGALVVLLMESNLF
ncbi:MAG TPA: hypothetical protein VKR30_09035 [Candidatus Limnocylindrales bacterium]|nr:hypothetical protein [Candidatus Limnocylindrales bacterium]